MRIRQPRIDGVRRVGLFRDHVTNCALARDVLAGGMDLGNIDKLLGIALVDAFAIAFGDAEFEGTDRVRLPVSRVEGRRASIEK